MSTTGRLIGFLFVLMASCSWATGIETTENWVRRYETLEAVPKVGPSLCLEIAGACVPGPIRPKHRRAAHPSLLDYSIRQWKTMPEMRIADAYKWLFHATLGGEHAVQSESEARSWLDDEWKTLSAPRKSEPLLVPLDPGGKLVRINLRPYKAAGNSEQSMLEVFVASARRFHAGKSAFTRVWRSLGQRLRRGAIGHLNRTEWQRFDREMRKNGYPACDHSPEYERAYHPAYRVVLRKLIRRG